MTSMAWTGTVTLGDGYRVSGDETNGAALIGEADWLEAVNDATWSGVVIVGIGDERFMGEIDASLGWGYSEYTPMDIDELRIGRHNIVEILMGMAGQTVVLTISDESVNLQEVRDNAARAITTRRIQQPTDIPAIV